MSGKKSRVIAPPTGRASKRDVPEATDGALLYTSELLRKMDRAFADTIRPGDGRLRARMSVLHPYQETAVVGAESVYDTRSCIGGWAIAPTQY